MDDLELLKIENVKSDSSPKSIGSHAHDVRMYRNPTRKRYARP